MRMLLYILLLCAFSANGQNIQLQGKLLNRQSDTVHIEVWSDGETIINTATTSPFYALVLGERPHYTIRISSGSIAKYCTLLCFNMEFENIQVDVDFKTRQSVLIYKNKRVTKSYNFLHYGAGNTRLREVAIYETD